MPVVHKGTGRRVSTGLFSAVPMVSWNAYQISSWPGDRFGEACGWDTNLKHHWSAFLCEMWQRRQLQNNWREVREGWAFTNVAVQRPHNSKVAFGFKGAISIALAAVSRSEYDCHLWTHCNIPEIVIFPCVANVSVLFLLTRCSKSVLIPPSDGHAGNGGVWSAFSCFIEMCLLNSWKHELGAQIYCLQFNLCIDINFFEWDRKLSTQIQLLNIPRTSWGQEVIWE